MTLDSDERGRLDRIEVTKHDLEKVTVAIGKAERETRQEILNDPANTRSVPPKANPYAYATREQLDRLFEAGFRKLGLDYFDLQKVVAEEDQAENRRGAQARADEVKGAEEAKRAQLLMNEKDWRSPVTEKLRLCDFVEVIPAHDNRFQIEKETGVVTAREPCPTCGHVWRYRLLDDLHLLLQDSSHNWLWIHVKHTHDFDPRNPRSSGSVIQPPMCLYLDTSAMARARLGKPYTLQQGVVAQVAGDRPYF